MGSSCFRVVVFGALYYKSYGNFKRRPSELNTRQEPAQLDVSFDVENFKKRSSEVNARKEPLKLDVTFDIEMGKDSDEADTDREQLRGRNLSSSPGIVSIPSPAQS
ncbi:hypothetical protein CBR_g22479 [Chara braunii]|uniref:Uncharacterized protein n=1 Tax=Chara braunii TaxID=69332 RepID=A0A388L2Q8_CHABU|nr:hypothetical protein CBR_g22479 [Chara braunii]|eukprot:GBG76600.1 hypothetical protein CBR_g22479 [Chara braunii]